MSNKRIVSVFLACCLGSALAAPMPGATTQWYLASQVFRATAAGPTGCPAVLEQTSAQRICATTLLPADSFRRLSQVILVEYLGRGTLIPLDSWSERGNALERNFLLEGGGWTLRYQAGEGGRGPRRNLVVVSYFPWRLTSPLLRLP